METKPLKRKNRTVTHHMLQIYIYAKNVKKTVCKYGIAVGENVLFTIFLY